MWNQPYLETCCRAALHRLHLTGREGRPVNQMDDACLQRLAGMGFCVRTGLRFRLTAEGMERHATEIVKQQPVRTAGR